MHTYIGELASYLARSVKHNHTSYINLHGTHYCGHTLYTTSRYGIIGRNGMIQSIVSPIVATNNAHTISDQIPVLC